jgi:putative phosphoesterase
VPPRQPTKLLQKIRMQGLLYSLAFNHGRKAMAQVKKGDRVKFNYALKLKDGKVVESNGSALEITVGKARRSRVWSSLIGEPGQTKTVVVKPADGYGPKDPAFVWTVPAAGLPAGTGLAVGTEVGFARADGSRVEGRIAKVEGDQVTVDGNHPLAGRNLTFEIKLVSIGWSRRSGCSRTSHDDMEAIARAVALFNAEAVVQVLHAGDIVSPFTFEIFRELRAPLSGVYGNNDGDRLLLRERSAGALHVQPHFVTLDGMRGVIVHEPPLAKSLARSGDFDLVICGHTHVPLVDRQGPALVLNPGKAARLHQGRSTVALLETTTREARIVDLSPRESLWLRSRRVRGGERLVEVGDAPPRGPSS